jgi:hypothetical protein
MLNFLWVIALILLVLWLLGFLITPFLGSFVHVLLVIGLILGIIWLWQRIKH